MATPRLTISRTPHGLLRQVARKVNGTPIEDGWCIVVPRAHLKREVGALLLDEGRGDAWVGSRVLTTRDLIQYYVRTMPGMNSITLLQSRQIIAAIVRRMHESDGAFAGQVVRGRVSEATLRSLTHLFSELEPLAFSADDLEERLESGPTSESASRRRHEVAEVYRRYHDILERNNYHAPLGEAVLAAEAAAALAPPAGVRRFLFAGLDGSGGSDVIMRLVRALQENDEVAEVEVVAVGPAPTEETAWALHGNDAILRPWVDSDEPWSVLPGEDPAEAEPDLAAVVRDPFAYRETPVPGTGAVQGVRLPDEQMQVEWIVADIKRRVLDEGVRPEEIAVVVRRLDDIAEEFEHECARLGVPVVSSREMRVSEVPAVRALLSAFRIPGRDWQASDLVSAAESPYLPLDLNPTLVSQIGQAGIAPTGARDWLARIDALEADTDPDDPGALRLIAHLRAGFAALVATMDDLAGPDGRKTAAGWIESLTRAVGAWKIEERVYAASGMAPRAERTRLARTDLDGMNAFIRAMKDWVRGREIAGLPNEPIPAAEWVREMESVAREMHIRLSTYPRDAVQLVDPAQAMLRSWEVVYVAGLTDGSFPARSGTDEHLVSEDDRRALSLPTAEHREAKERLYFHLAAATARRTLVLVTLAADDRGKALVASPYLTCMSLRIEGFGTRDVRANAMSTDAEEHALSIRDIDLIAAHRFRDLASLVGSEAERVRGAVASDRILRLWLGQAGARRALHGWGVEHFRRRLPAALLAGTAGEDACRTHAGILSPEELSAVADTSSMAFSPSDFSTFQGCRFRFFGTKLLGLRPNREDPDDHDEAAAFGTLQHRVLERLYKALSESGSLPPRSAEDVEAAVQMLDDVARREVLAYTTSSRERLWKLDFAFVTDVLREFVRRDLSGLMHGQSGHGGARLRTRIRDLEMRAGREAEPIEIERDGVRFRLQGTIDRVEEIDDPRLSGDAAAANGWLIVRDYKGGRTKWTPSVQHYLDGKSLQLPLYASMVERITGQRVFGFGELRTALPADPDMVAVRDVRTTPAGVRLVRPRQAANPVRDSMQKAEEVAAGVVRQVRDADFSPQGDRKCFGCHLSDVCRSARIRNPGRMRERASMPLSVSADEFVRASEEAADAG